MRAPTRRCRSVSRAGERGRLLEGELRTAAERFAAALLDVLGDPAGLDHLAERERTRAGRRWPSAPIGSLGAVLDPDTIDASTVLRLRPGVRITESEAEVVVSDASRRMTAPTVTREALLALAGEVDLAVGDLPGLDASSRVVLARRLVRDGFVHPVPRCAE